MTVAAVSAVAVATLLHAIHSSLLPEQRTTQPELIAKQLSYPAAQIGRPF